MYSLQLLTKLHSKENELLKKEYDNHGINIRHEALWFMKIAWNLALENSKVSSCTEQFFTLCAKFSSLCDMDENSLVRQKTCLLMAAAAALEIAREQPEFDDKKQAWQQALEHARSCKEVLKQLQETTKKDIGSTNDPSPVLLLLYEYEALAKLGHNKELEAVMNQALANPNTEIKTLDTLAALSMEPPAQHTGLSKRALHASIQKHLQHTDIDVNKCSKAIHSLVQLILGDNDVSVASNVQDAWSHKAIHSLVQLILGDNDVSVASNVQDAWSQYGIAIKLLESTHKQSYPQSCTTDPW
ncbi:testis-expressed protein 11-like [Amphiura filiformis]|uniref:testis-expressed protein 11-like n=1 Tax=Amphiura filiformis TaxID=82378 RepID=UPI003B21735D